MKFNKKASLLVAAAFLGLATTATAQSKFYVGAQVGYGLPANGDVMGVEGNSTSLKNVYGSVGGGFTAGINVGYNITNFLSFDLGGQFLAGSTVTEMDYAIDGYSEKQTMHTSQIRLIPSLVVKGGEGALKPFARFGVILPVSGKTTQEYTEVDPTAMGNKTTNRTYEFKGALSLGFDAGVGISYDLNENLSLTAELNYTALRIKTKSGEMTDYSVKLGETPMAGLENVPGYLQNINFVDELNSSTNDGEYGTNFDENKASDQLARRTNFNSIGLKVGVKYNF